jgi:hypothetical protein
VASDQGFHDLSPADAFNEEFQRRLTKSDWLEGGFEVHIDPVTTAIYRGMGFDLVAFRFQSTVHRILVEGYDPARRGNLGQWPLGLHTR